MKKTSLVKLVIVALMIGLFLMGLDFWVSCRTKIHLEIGFRT